MRLMLGVEKLAAQGIFLLYTPGEQDAIITDSLLGDMAGNAFCTCHVVVCLFVGLYGLAFGAVAEVEEQEEDDTTEPAFDTAFSREQLGAGGICDERTTSFSFKL